MSHERIICADPGRSLLYEELLKYFVDQGKVETAPMGKCKICGAIVPVVNADKDTCLAQSAIVSKRMLRLADGEPVTVDAKTVRGKNSFNDKDFILIASAERSFITTNITPVTELPPTVTAVRKGEVFASAIRQQLFENPPKPPYVAVIFAGRAATVPIIRVEDDNIVTISGGQIPISMDRRTFADSLESARGIGREMFELVGEMRRALLEQGDPSTLRATIDGRPKTISNQDAVAILSSKGISRDTIERCPPAGSQLYDLIRTILFNDSDQTSAQQSKGNE